MGYTQQLLDDVRAQLAPEDVVLKEAKDRRELVLRAAESFPGVSRGRSFASGSLAHGTANCPVHERDKGLDADCGIVLDRRSHPTLGSDSPQQEGPTRIVEQVRIHLRPKIRAEYPTQFSTVPVHPAAAVQDEQADGRSERSPRSASS